MISQLSYPFALGVLAAVNPCGFPMLPGYLSFFIGERAGQRSPAGATPATSARLVAAVRSSVAVSLGFAAVFAILGAAFRAGLSAFMNWVPWVMIVVAVALGVLGLAGLAGRPLNLRLPHLHLGGGSASMRSMFGYGISYAVASLTCSLPLFLSGVAGAFTRSGLATGIGTFLAYSVGMAAVLTVVTVAVALARTSIISGLRRSGRHLDRAGSGLLVLVALYLMDYWVSYLHDPTASTGPVALVSHFQTILASNLDHPAIEAFFGLAAAALVVVIVGFRLSARAETGRPETGGRRAGGKDAARALGRGDTT